MSESEKDTKKPKTQTLTLNWSNLPPKIIQSIAKHLTNQKDFQNFQQICKKWRKSTTISSILPNPISLPCTPTHQILSSTTVYLIHRPNTTPWIFTTTMGSTHFHHPFTGTPFHNLPENPDFGPFRPRKLAVGYRLLPSNVKAIVFSSCCSFYNVCDVSVLTLYNGGHLCGYRYRNECGSGKWDSFEGLSYDSVDKFDDFVVFKGIKCVLDREGRLYQVDYEGDSLKVVRTLVKGGFSGPKGHSKNRKRLAGFCGSELYLVVRVFVGSEHLRVYKLSHNGKKWGWVKAEDFGNYVLFVTSDHCFFVPMEEFPHCQVVRSCIVFSRDAFPRHVTFPDEGNDQKEIFVFWLKDGIAKGQLYSWLSLHSMMWSPRPTISHSDLLRELQKGVAMISHSKSQERTASTLVADDASNVPKEEILEEKVTGSTSVIPSTSEASEICITEMKFQGVDIKSYLLPTLETIWAKHGNLIGEDTVRSKGMLACALELLANMVITLQNSNARTLTDVAVEELKSNLMDLQCARLKVDWLVPIVKKVLAFQKSKPLIESIMALDKAIAEVDEKEREFLAESGKKKQELEKRRMCLSARILLSEPIDLDECFGMGIC